MDRRRLIPILILSLVTLGVLLVPAHAGADPIEEKKAEAQRIREAVAVFDARLERVIDEYNQAAEDLKTVRGQIRKNKKALKRAKRELAESRTQLDERVAAIYKQRQVNIIDVFFSADSFDEIAGQIELMRRVGEHDSELVDEVEAHKQQIKKKRQSLISDRDEATELVDEVAATRDEIEGALAERQSMLAGVEDEIRELEEAEAEAARRAAEAAEEEAEQVAQSSSASRSSADGSSGSSSGSSAPSSTPPQPPPAPSGGGRSNIPAIAARYLGTPYQYGGTSPQTGFDCSGFVQYVYRQAGISLPRTSQLQQQVGTRVPMNALQPGDLVFRGYPAYHVGIYAGGGQAIHSPRTGYTVCYQSISYWTSAVRP